MKSANWILLSAIVFAAVFLPDLGKTGEEGSPVRIFSIPVREELKLLVNDATDTPHGAALATSRGEIWILANPREEHTRHRDYHWTRFAQGLRRPEKIAWSDGAILVKQLPEVTSLSDTDGDGCADRYRKAETVRSDSVFEPKGPGKIPFRGVVLPQSPLQKGPFAGQFIAGGRKGNYLNRITVVDSGGRRQSAMFVFQRGLRYAVDAVLELNAETFLVPQSNRSDPDRTRLKFALQKIEVDWESLFEARELQATSRGVRIFFTRKLLVEPAVSEWSYSIESMDQGKKIEITQVEISEDKQSVELICEGGSLAPDHFYLISCEGVWSHDREPVRNPGALFIVEEKAD